MENTSKKSGSYKRKVMREYNKILEKETGDAQQLLENHDHDDG